MRICSILLQVWRIFCSYLSCTRQVSESPLSYAISVCHCWERMTKKKINKIYTFPQGFSTQPQERCSLLSSEGGIFVVVCLSLQPGVTCSIPRDENKFSVTAVSVTGSCASGSLEQDDLFGVYGLVLQLQRPACHASCSTAWLSDVHRVISSAIVCITQLGWKSSRSRPAISYCCTEYLECLQEKWYLWRRHQSRKIIPPQPCRVWVG